VVEAGTSLQDVVLDHVLRRARRRLAVVREGRPVGLIDVASIGGVPRERWSVTPVEQAMRPIPASVSPEAELAEVFERLDEAASPVPVVTDDRLVGLLDLQQVLRYAQLREELQVPVSTTRPATV
jgi:CBS domain-containing protein